MHNTLMGGMAKELVDELRTEDAAHAHDVWLKKAVWTCRVCLILLGDLKVDVVNTVFDHCLDYKGLALRVPEGACQECFMGGPAETAIRFESAYGEGFWAICGGPVVWIQ